MTQIASANPTQPTPRARFQKQHPHLFYLDPDERERDELAAYLKNTGFLSKDEPVQSVTRAGDGNMNCTVRVYTHRRSFIVKQSRPWVEKYPQFDEIGRAHV